MATGNARLENKEKRQNASPNIQAMPERNTIISINDNKLHAAGACNPRVAELLRTNNIEAAAVLADTLFPGSDVVMYASDGPKVDPTP